MSPAPVSACPCQHRPGAPRPCPPPSRPRGADGVRSQGGQLPLQLPNHFRTMGGDTDLQCLASGLSKHTNQPLQLGPGQFITPRVGQHGDPPGFADPAHRFADLGPLGFHVGRLGLGQIALKRLLAILAGTGLHQRLGKMWAGGNTLGGAFSRSFQPPGITQSGQPLRHDSRALPATVHLALQAPLKTFVPCIHPQPHNMDIHVAPAGRHLNPGNQGKAALGTDAPRLRQPGHGIMICYGQGGHTGIRRQGH